MRYDKRGVGGSVDLAPAENDLTIDVFAKDAPVIAQWAKQLAMSARSSWSGTARAAWWL